MRETRHLAAPGLNPFEIIPACAGNIAARCAPCSPGRDHPRVCGEHVIGEVVYFVLPGSSPRVRGTLAVGEVGMQHLGIIPACAGNIVGHIFALDGQGDHPRVCGEHSSHTVSQ